jgi:hypothetical protein
MSRAAKRTNDHYVEVGYEDKVVFTLKKKGKSQTDLVTTWRKSQGLWAGHPVFRGMAIQEVIEWLRGEDCDVEDQS